MDAKTQVAIITAAASIAVAALSFAFTALTSAITRRAERRAALQQRKLEHYQDLLGALSDLAVDGVDKREANQRFARAVNTIALVAPQPVITALMAFHEEVKFSNSDRSQAKHDQLLRCLVLTIRKSLDLPFPDDPSTFSFHLIGSAPPSDSSRESHTTNTGPTVFSTH